MYDVKSGKQQQQQQQNDVLILNFKSGPFLAPYQWPFSKINSKCSKKSILLCQWMSYKFIINNIKKLILDYLFPLWGFLGVMKQTNSNGHNKVKNPNWQEAASWLRLQAWPRIFELGRTENKSSKWPEWDSNLEPLNWVWCTDHLGVLPPWKLSLKDMAGTLKGNSIRPQSFSALSYRCT